MTERLGWTRGYGVVETAELGEDEAERLVEEFATWTKTSDAND